MNRKVTDLKQGQNPEINLNKGQKKRPLKFTKSASSQQNITDIKGQKKKHYLYFRGGQTEVPSFLGNLIRIGIFGIIIVLIINSVNVYFKSKKLEKDISDSAYQGINLLMDAGRNTGKIKFSQANKLFGDAKENFLQARKNLWFISSDKTFYAENKSLSQGVNALIKSGEHFSLAGGHFVDAMDDFQKIPVYFVGKNSFDSQIKDKISITDTLKTGLEKAKNAIGEISIAKDEMAKVNPELFPAEIRGRIITLQDNIGQIAATLRATVDYFPAMLKLLGDTHPHRYLILLQNNNEIRPSGGFIGSYAIVDLKEGYIENLEVHDSYDIDGSYAPHIDPPEEFTPFTSNWRFRDSNYSADFPLTAAKARWFLEQEGGGGVDTVIALNQGILESILDITGPVQVGQFGKINKDNYNLLLSYVIEGKVWGAEDPKHILKVFIPAVKDALFKEENLGKLTSKLYLAVQQKHIMMWSADQDIEDLFVAAGLAGKVTQTAEDEDYLSIINISIGGTKPEAFTRETIDHHSNIDKKGKVTDELHITREHQWTDDIYFVWKRILSNYGFNTMDDHIVDILGRGDNITNLKIYVPEGSKLLDSQNADGQVETGYDKELKKTYFLTKMQVPKGKSKEIYLKYELPFQLKGTVANYKLISEKQPGSRGSIFNKSISFDPTYSLLEKYPTDMKKNSDNSIVYFGNLAYDRYISVLLSAKHFF